MRRIKVMGYGLSNITINPWPQVERLPDGTWRRVWRFVLGEDIAPGVELDALSSSIGEQIVADLRAVDPRLSDIKRDDLSVCLQRIAPCEITATVLTRQDGWSDEFYFATYQLFKYVDERVGTIDTIEGQPKDAWRPWRR
jgi:hypothetical protein